MSDKVVSMIRIQDVLTDPQIRAVVEIMEISNPQDRVKRVTAYLESLEPKLIHKGILPAYLAWILEAVLVVGDPIDIVRNN